MPKAVSKRQARFFGAVAGGKIHKPGLSMDEAAERLRGIDMRRLPSRKRKAKKR